MKVTIDKFQILDDNLIVDMKTFKGSGIGVLKSDRTRKFILHKTADYYEGVELNTMLLVLVFSNSFKNIDLYDIGEIKLTINI